MEQINQKNYNKKENMIKQQVKNKDKGQVAQKQVENKMGNNN